MSSDDDSEIRDGFCFTFKDGKTRCIGVDKAGNLYWDGKPIELKQRVQLSGWLNAAAIAAALGTVVQAVVAVLALLG